MAENGGFLTFWLPLTSTKKLTIKIACIRVEKQNMITNSKQGLKWKWVSIQKGAIYIFHSYLRFIFLQASGVGRGRSKATPE